MALLLTDNRYFKIDIDGYYIIYKNKTARNSHKKATDSSIVLEKYKEVSDNLYSPERNYYDNAGLEAERAALAKEEAQYREDLETFNTEHSYPLMEQYIPDIKKTIPKALEKGRIGVGKKCDTLEEVYNRIKEFKLFGECEDI